MKKILMFMTAVAGILALSCNTSAYTNYFKEGTEWTVAYLENIDGFSEPVSTEVSYKIEGTGYFNGFDLSVLWIKNPGEDYKPYAAISCTGDKVIYYSPEDIVNLKNGDDFYPRLLYDFDLQYGEELAINQPVNSGSKNVKVVSISSIESCDRVFPTGTIQSTDRLNVGTYSPNEWIFGIGSTRGLLENGSEITSGNKWSRLVKVTSDGETVYYKPVSESGVSLMERETSDEDSVCYDLNGMPLKERPAKGIVISNGKKRLIK